MTLIDTSVWVRYFKGLDEARFAGDRIREDTALLHPLVFGEMLLGGLSTRNQSLLQALPLAPAHQPERIYEFIKENSLSGQGVGWVDAAILCATVEAGAVLATFDETLRSCAEHLGLPCMSGR